MARFFFIFHALSLELNFFFDRRFPLNPKGTVFSNFPLVENPARILQDLIGSCIL